MKLMAALVVIAALGPAAALAQGTAPTPAPVSPRVAAVEAYRQAKHNHDWDTVRSLITTDARIWFDEKAGEGSPLKAEGGPWAEWDQFFNGKGTREGDYEEGDATVSMVVNETNDYYRLLDRPGSRYRATYYFTGDNKIEGILIHGLESEAGVVARDRTNEFEEWARKHHAAALKKLMPEGRIVPSAENARVWRELLVEWRAAAGLPPIE